MTEVTPLTLQNNYLCLWICDRQELSTTYFKLKGVSSVLNLIVNFVAYDATLIIHSMI
jgi:hypothetical protein